MKVHFKNISTLFVVLLCLTSSVLFGQNPPPTPSNPNPLNPVVVPAPVTNPQALPPDTASIHISPSSNPVPQPFPKSQEDTVFRSIETTPDPMKMDSVNRPRK